MGFIPKLCLLKVKYLRDSKVRDDMKTYANGGMSDNSKKAINLISFVRVTHYVITVLDSSLAHYPYA